MVARDIRSAQTGLFLTITPPQLPVRNASSLQELFVQLDMPGDPSSAPRLAYDVGFNNGDDSFYYLSRGLSVVAVEANAALVDEGKVRFASEIASGRLTLVNAALWERSGETKTFFINDSEHLQSSFDQERGKRGGNYREITVNTITIGDLFAQYGVPWYLKIDIEGADEMVIRTLPRNVGAPKYLSFEVAHGCPAIELLSPLGYTGFKLINPETLTQSLPIFEHEFAMRLLRKPSTRSPRFRSLIASLPDSMRPQENPVGPRPGSFGLQLFDSHYRTIRGGNGGPLEKRG